MNIWPAIIGALSALAGAFLANMFAEKRWNKQLVHEAEKERRTLIRTKGEELFRALRKWEKELYFFNASRIGYLQGVVPHKEVIKIVDEKIDPLTHGSVDILFALYFEHLTPELEALHKQVTKVNQHFHRNDQNIPNLAAAETMKKECAIYERLTEQLVRKLKVAIKSI